MKRVKRFSWNSLQFRITIIWIFIIGILIGIAAFYSYQQTRQQLFSAYQQQGETLAQILGSVISTSEEFSSEKTRSVLNSIVSSSNIPAFQVTDVTNQIRLSYHPELIKNRGMANSNAPRFFENDNLLLIHKKINSIAYGPLQLTLVFDISTLYDNLYQTRNKTVRLFFILFVINIFLSIWIGRLTVQPFMNFLVRLKNIRINGKIDVPPGNEKHGSELNGFQQVILDLLTPVQNLWQNAKATIKLLFSEQQKLSRNFEELESRVNYQKGIFNDTQNSIQEVDSSLTIAENSIAQLAKSISQVSENTLDILENLNTMADGAKVMMNSVNQTSSAIEELVASIEQISQNVSSANQITLNAHKVASEGEETIQSSLEGIEIVASKIDEGYLKIKRLDQSSKKIGEIINVIGDVADRTNLLALNAAIEAARAGEAGKGFAVVAEEIRKLAEKTTQATQEIGNMIRNIHTDTAVVVEVMTQSKTEVDKGLVKSDRAKQALNEIQSQVKEVYNIMNEISIATQQQTEGAGQIIDAVEDMRRLTKNVNQAIQNQAQKNESIRYSINNLKHISEKTTIAVTQQTLKIKNITETMGELNLLATEIHQFTQQIKENLHRLGNLTTNLKDIIFDTGDGEALPQADISEKIEDVLPYNSQQTPEHSEEADQWN